MTIPVVIPASLTDGISSIDDNNAQNNKSRTSRMTEFLDTPPQDDRVTDYDRTHLGIYLRLIDAEQAGADWQEAARIVLRLNPEAHPDETRLVHDSHLARARWMVAQGYRDLASIPR